MPADCTRQASLDVNSKQLSSHATDFAVLRTEFPMLSQPFEGRPLVYLDSAATSLKPQSVIDALVQYYSRCTANVHRGNHLLSEQADELFDDARGKVARLIRAVPEQLVWTAGTTDAINQVVAMLGLEAGDHVLVSALEHHSNLLPYRIKANVHVARLDEYGQIDAEHFGELLRDFRPRLVALSQVSNVLGTVQDLEPLLRMAREAGAMTLVDGAQSVPRMPVDVNRLDCDFLAFSSHKMLGPTGIGALAIRDTLLDELMPARVGGGMVKSVNAETHEWERPPFRFEAGTPHIAGAIGFGAAADYLRFRAPLRDVCEHERQLTGRLVEGLSAIPRVRLWPREAPSRVGIVSFTVDGLLSDEVAMLLSHRGNIMVRSGVHCAEPLARAMGVKSFVRASLYFYNTAEDVDVLLGLLSTTVQHLKEVNVS